MNKINIDNLLFPEDEFFPKWRAKHGDIRNFDKPARDLALEHVQNFKRVIDVGAHVGISALHWADHFEKIEAFEPNIYNRECLTLNTLPIAYKVHIYHCALSNTTAQMEAVYRSSKNSGSFQLINPMYKKTKSVRFPVEVKPLDSFNFTDVGLIKIDVEGWEVEVLEGAANTINQCSPVLMLEFGGEVKTIKRVNSDALMGFMSRYDYELVATHESDSIFVRKN